MVTNEELIQQQLQSGFKLPPQNRYYANSFVMGTSPADVVVVVMQNGESVATINMSHQLAKTLAEKLSSLIKGIEEKTGQPILTTDAIGSALGLGVKEAD